MNEYEIIKLNILKPGETVKFIWQGINLTGFVIDAEHILRKDKNAFIFISNIENVEYYLFSSPNISGTETNIFCFEHEDLKPTRIVLIEKYNKGFDI